MCATMAHVVAGHVTRTGTRADVDPQSEFMRDLKDAAGEALKSTRVGTAWTRTTWRMHGRCSATISIALSVRQRADTKVVGEAGRL